MTRLIELFPTDGIRQVNVDEYNSQTREAIEYIRDFVIMHYKVTNRTDSPMWRYCREMDVPERLKQRLQLFRETGRFVHRQPDLFGENSWVQVMMGQGIVPASHAPIVRNLDDGDLSDFLASIRKDVARKLVQLPMHRQFLNDYCPAPMPEAMTAPAIR